MKVGTGFIVICFMYVASSFSQDFFCDECGKRTLSGCCQVCGYKSYPVDSYPEHITRKDLLYFAKNLEYLTLKEKYPGRRIRSGEERISSHDIAVDQRFQRILHDEDFSGALLRKNKEYVQKGEDNTADYEALCFWRNHFQSFIEQLKNKIEGILINAESQRISNIQTQGSELIQQLVSANNPGSAHLETSIGEELSSSALWEIVEQQALISGHLSELLGLPVLQAAQQTLVEGNYQVLLIFSFQFLGCLFVHIEPRHGGGSLVLTTQFGSWLINSEHVQGILRRLAELCKRSVSGYKVDPET